MTDTERKNVTTVEETEAERTRRKADKHKALSLFKAELRRQAQDKIQTFIEINTDEMRVFRKKNTPNRAELRAEMTPEESIQVQEINATHQIAPRTRPTLRIVGAAIGELQFFQEQIHSHHLPPMEEICQFCQAVNGKINQQIVAVD